MSAHKREIRKNLIKKLKYPIPGLFDLKLIT